MFQFSNRARSILARNVTAGDTTLIVASGTGAEFPSSSGPEDAIALTLVSASTSRQYEIVYCIRRDNDTFTVWRGQEGTTPLSFQSGDMISLNMTAALYRRMTQAGYLGQFSQEVAQSPAAYRKGAIVCDETDAAVYWISLQDQNSTTPGDDNPAWMKLDVPFLQHKADNSDSALMNGVQIMGCTLDAVDETFFSREQARLLTAIQQRTAFAREIQQTALLKQQAILTARKLGVSS